MTLNLDISTELDTLKRKMICLKCENIFRNPYVISKCRHIFCFECLNLHNCFICEANYKSVDIEKYKLLHDVVDIIRTTEIHCEEGNKTEDNSLLYRDVQLYVDVWRNTKGETSLHISARKGDVTILNQLVADKIDLNIQDNAGWTALHEAVVKNHYGCVEILLNAGAYPNVPGDCYMTPLHKAVYLKHYDIVKLLLSYGANPNAVDYEGNTPMILGDENIMEIISTTSTKEKIVKKVFLNAAVFAYVSEIDPKRKSIIERSDHIKTVVFKNFLEKNKTTHFIVGMTENVSFNYLVAILKGVFIVRENWIDDFINTKTVKIPLTFMPNKVDLKIREAINNSLQKNPRLFHGMNFHIADTNKLVIYNLEIKATDLTTLLKIGGGTILYRAPTPRTVESKFLYPYHIERNSSLSQCANYIVYMCNPPELCYNMKELQHRSATWVIDCILNFKIIT